LKDHYKENTNNKQVLKAIYLEENVEKEKVSLENT